MSGSNSYVADPDDNVVDVNIALPARYLTGPGETQKNLIVLFLPASAYQLRYDVQECPDLSYLLMRRLLEHQAIPRGLHVRMNLQTGEREAKLLDLEEEDIDRQRRMTEIIASEPPSPAPDYRPPEPDEPVKFDKSELKQALHKMEDDFTGESENVARVRKQFRSYSELKKELGEIKLNMKTDLEVLGQLIDDYRQTIDRRSGGAVDKKEHELEESLLSQMEYLVHQYDNAIDFVKRDGNAGSGVGPANSGGRRARSGRSCGEAPPAAPAEPLDADCRGGLVSSADDASVKTFRGPASCRSAVRRHGV
ncbi:unnamed protein product, partial [Nesidiocoris tenuis]